MKLIPWKDRHPARPMETIQREMNRLFDSFFGRGFDIEPFKSIQGWEPAVDVTETDDAVVIKADLPGLEEKDIEVNLTGDMLTLKGEKRAEKEAKGENFYHVERTSGVFERSFRLPASVQQDKVSATFKNGVLTIDLPKAEESKSKSVRIKVE